jgi:hypothetical protein
MAFLREGLTHPAKNAAVAQLEPIAAELGCTLAQLAIAWAAHNPRVSTVITGRLALSQLQSNLGALAVLERLTPELLARIDAPPRRWRAEAEGRFSAASRSAVPTSVHGPGQRSAPSRAARSRGPAAGAAAAACPARCRRTAPPEQAHAGPGEASAASATGGAGASMPKSPCGWCGALGTSHRWASSGPCAKRCKAAGSNTKPGRKTSPDTTQKAVAQQRQRLGDATGGFQRPAMVAAFAAVVDAQAPARAVAQRGRELLFQPGGVDHHLVHAASGQRQQVPFDQRPAAAPQQRLGRVVGQRPQALAAAGGQDQGACGHGPRACTASAQPDRRRRRVDDLAEQRPVAVFRFVPGQRVLVGGEGGVQFDPVGFGEQALGGRDDVVLFARHVLQVDAVM